MAAARRRTAEEIAAALFWAIIGGALIGGSLLTLGSMLGNPPKDVPQAFGMAVLGPLILAAYSLIVVVPCAVLFGLPSALPIARFGLSRWMSLIIVLLSATAAQVAFSLMITDELPEVRDFLLTAPFAYASAMILWWRLTRDAAA